MGLKATHSSLEEEFTYDNRKILNMESHVQEIKGTKKARTYQGWSQNDNTAGNLSVTHVPYHIVNLAHIKDRSQTTLRRKGFHHELMHGLTNPRIRIS